MDFNEEGTFFVSYVIDTLIGPTRHALGESNYLAMASAGR